MTPQPIESLGPDVDSFVTTIGTSWLEIVIWAVIGLVGLSLIIHLWRSVGRRNTSVDFNYVPPWSPVKKGLIIGGVIGLVNFAFAVLWGMASGGVLVAVYGVFAGLGLIIGPLLGGLYGALTDRWEPPTESPIPSPSSLRGRRPTLPQPHRGIRIDKIPVSGSPIVGCAILVVVGFIYLVLTIAFPVFGLIVMAGIAFRFWISSRGNKRGKSGEIIFTDQDQDSTDS